METSTSDNSGTSASENFGTNVGTNVIVTRISELVAPIVSDLGLDLYDLEFVSGVVRVVVDTKPGTLGENGRPAGVDLEKNRYLKQYADNLRRIILSTMQGVIVEVRR